MDVNEWVVRGLMSNIAVIGLFMVPIITMRLFAEEKRSGTMELLVTSPLRDLEIILGKWLAAVILYAVMLGLSLLNILTLYRVRQTGLEADDDWLFGAAAAGRWHAGDGRVSSRRAPRIRLSRPWADLASCYCCGSSVGHRRWIIQCFLKSWRIFRLTITWSRLPRAYSIPRTLSFT